MAQRAMDAYRCVHCNALARFVVLPVAQKEIEERYQVNEGLLNGLAVECPRENKLCKPPDLDSFDLSLANDGVKLGEVQFLAAITGLKFDATCQKPLRDATVGCLFCLVGVGRAILTCAQPMIKRGEDFVVVPDWLYETVHVYIRGYIHSLHTDEHKAVFETKPKRRNKKVDEIKRKTADRSWKCLGCGMFNEKKAAKRHAKLCNYGSYTCIFCKKDGFSERGLRPHLQCCRGKDRPDEILTDKKAMRALVRQIVEGQDKHRDKYRALTEKEQNKKRAATEQIAD